MTAIQPLVPLKALDLRTSIYAGAIYLSPANPASEHLVEYLLGLVRSKYGEDFRYVHRRKSSQELLSILSGLKRSVYEDLQIQRIISDILTELGLLPTEDYLVDPLRVRAVFHEGHNQENALTAYSLHRDTWYANSQSQINFWIPLHDVKEAETFSFFPAYFNTAVGNNSSQFFYDNWIEKVGFGNSQLREPAFYPVVDQPFLEENTERLMFSCRAGEILIFSAAHLHGTNLNDSGRSRFSVDFRAVHLSDHEAGFGAPNVDNASSGSAIKDYIKLSG